MEKSIEDFSVNGTVTAFCLAWPLVKAGLELLEKSDPKIKPIIDKVIAGGDELSGLICTVPAAAKKA